MTAYLTSLLEIIRPKVVLTHIDNSFKFCDVARALDKKMSFVAIQSAARYELKEHKHLYSKNMSRSDLNKKIYIPNYLCFGQFEIDDFRHHGIEVKNFFKVGSLNLANFFHYIKENKIKLKKFVYDICLISEGVPGMDDFIGEKNIEKGFVATMKFTIKFCMKHNMKLIFTWRRDKRLSPASYKAELVYYKKYLTDSEFNYLISNSLENNRQTYSSYAAMAQSKVVVGFTSTMLREYLAVGGKILSCKLIPLDVYDFPIQGICSIENCTFPEFEKRLLEIHLMSKENYFSQLSKDKCYTAEYNENISTIDIIKKKIDNLLTDKSLSEKSEKIFTNYNIQ